uniref:NADH dehydrogenase [ubiquinone] 1 alpha subcomplex subunit 13 n=1 Tax=Haptolina ericina TaxID=156174 RepID=A0A7S3ES85_9EUKA
MPGSGFVQDGPPTGGYKMVKTARNIPKGGASSISMAVGAVALFGFGFYKIVQGNKLRREWKREEMDIRMSVMPFLTAEEDVQSVFLQSKKLENEAELMKDVKGWEVGKSVYNDGRWRRPMEIKGLEIKDLKF